MVSIKPFLTIILFFIIFSTNSIAQRLDKGKTVQGFVINNKQDTIHGVIEIEDYELAETRVKFTEKRGKDLMKSKVYKPKDLKGYAVKVQVNNNSAQIEEVWMPFVRKEVEEVPRPFAANTVFLERRESGRVNLYSYYVLSNTSAGLIQYFLLENANSGKMVKVTETTFQEVTANYFNDCAILKNRFGRADFSYLNLEQIVHIYNRCKVEALPDKS